MSRCKPVYLLADSQVLFWKDSDALFLRSVLNFIDAAAPSAAYIGAANGDQAAFYEIFVAAMEGIGIRRCHQIRADFPDGQRQQLEAANVIVLAGGDVKTGWDIIVETGMREVIQRRYSEGAVLIGVSAGAVQLGTGALQADTGGEHSLLPMLRIVPFVIDAHAEKTGWDQLRTAVALQGGPEQGIGIPTGGAVIYHPDHSLEPVRHSFAQFTRREEQLSCALVNPQTQREKTPLH